MADLTSPIVGTAEGYAAFVALCRARIVELGVTYETIDRIAGFSDRHTAALMAGSKAMSVWSFFTLARALALMPSFQHDADQLRRLQDQSNWIGMRRTGPRFRPSPKPRKRKTRCVLDTPRPL